MKHTSKDQTFIPIRTIKMIYTVSKQIGFKFFITITISSFLIIFGYSFAENSNDIDNGDCGFVQETTGGNFGTVLENWSLENEVIYPKESIRRALLNLKASCCQKNIIGSQTARCKYDKDNGFFLSNYPDSKFLYDHLVDIGLRRLDGMEKLLYEGTTQDPIGKERREFINTKGSQEEGTTPTDILPKFKEQWTLNINHILPDREDANYNQQYKNERASVAGQYTDRPLVNRYSNLCKVSAYIYGYLGLKLGYYTRTNLYSSCEGLSQNTISRNITFTKSIVLKKSNKILYDNINSHITNYLSQSRLAKLKETILGIVQSLNVVNKKVIKLIKECS